MQKKKWSGFASVNTVRDNWTRQVFCLSQSTVTFLRYNKVVLGLKPKRLMGAGVWTFLCESNSERKKNVYMVPNLSLFVFLLFI